MTINCARWEQIAFSAVYYAAGQKVLVGVDSGIESIEDLAGKRICAPAGTTSIDNIQKIQPDAIPVTSTDNSACMVLFQNGEADGVSTDDTVLAGLAAQDPYAEVLATEFLTQEPYGIGVNAEQPRPGAADQPGARGHARRRPLAGVLRHVAGARPRRPRTPAQARLRPMSAVTDATTHAPAAPGAMGSAPEPAELQSYLSGLEAWVRARRSELDDLDATALAAGRGAEVGSDMALALSLWKGVSDRYQEMWATWDGGRVLQPQREQIASLIWGRLEGQGVSVPEACRLSDALAGQLRTRLALTPGADAAAARIKDLRAQLERIRDQVGLEPALGRDSAVDRLAALMVRLNEIAERAGRGADVGGLLAPFEQDAAVFERDLIVGNQRRRDARGQVEQARRVRADLEAREGELTTLAAHLRGHRRPGPSLRRARRRCPGTRAQHPRDDRPLPRAPRPGRAGDGPRPRPVRRRAGRAHRPGRAARRLRRQGPRHRSRRPARSRHQRAAGPRRAGAPAGTHARGSPARGDVPDLARRPEGPVIMTCTQPGCSGTITDGYCDVCGMAAAPAAGTTDAPTSKRTVPAADGATCTQPGCSGTIADGYCDTCGMAAAAGPAPGGGAGRHR